MADGEEPMAKHRSSLKDFLASIATMTGDLSNITAPPFVLDPRSVIEIPAFWAENPSIFVSPVRSDDPVQRALLVLRSFLSGLYSQCYMGRSPEVGVKKPLNAFLGELFIGKWEDENGTTHMISEQVSHHPPITACRVWNDEHGVIAEGYNRQTVTFNGNVNVECIGHILKTLTKYDEHYLMPIPDFKVKGILGTPYPELNGTYYIPSTNGVYAVMHFSGKSFFSSNKKHSFEAHLFKEQDGESNPLYTIEGQWDTEFTIRDNKNGKDLEVFKIAENALKKVPPLIVEPIEEQDPWESRRAWKDTVSAIKSNNMQGVTDAKGTIENGQRAMREDEEKRGETWQPLFFKQSEDDNLVAQLNTKVPNEDYRKSRAQTEGIWSFIPQAWKTVKKPYHGNLRPDNTSTNTEEASSKPVDTRTGDEKTNKNEESVSSHGAQQHKTELPYRPAASKRIDHPTASTEAERPKKPESELANGVRQSEANGTEGVAKSQTEPQITPQVEQKSAVGEQHGSGVEGMSSQEKKQIENMLRDQYSSTVSKARRDSRAKRRSAGSTHQ